jgi:hypothetical protein
METYGQWIVVLPPVKEHLLYKRLGGPLTQSGLHRKERILNRAGLERDTQKRTVRALARSYKICGLRSGTGAGFLRVLPFPLPILISPTAPHSSSIVAGTVVIYIYIYIIAV